MQNYSNKLGLGQPGAGGYREHDILVIADFWRLNMDRIIMEVTGLDGWAHSSPSEIPASCNKWMAENDRFCIVTATLGEAMSGLRVKDEDGKQIPFSVDALRQLCAIAGVATVAFRTYTTEVGAKEKN